MEVKEEMLSQNFPQLLMLNFNISFSSILYSTEKEKFPQIEKSKCPGADSRGQAPFPQTLGFEALIYFPLNILTWFH